MSDCIFCKIVQGEIPCEKVYEDRNVLAFMDIKPINKGHVLIVHKHHKRDLADLSDEELSAVMRSVRMVAVAVKKATKADGFNIGMNNGSAAGQVVFHAHVHVIPRFANDGLQSWPEKECAQDEIASIAKNIRAALK
ncbi:MAG: HIT family protein [archaeon]